VKYHIARQNNRRYPHVVPQEGELKYDLTTCRRYVDIVGVYVRQIKDAIIGYGKSVIECDNLHMKGMRMISTLVLTTWELRSLIKMALLCHEGNK
jgi:hypothetical protein